MVTRHPRQRDGESGQALVLALFVVLLLSLALALVAASLGRGMRNVRHQARDLHLTALTDAAVAAGLAHLAEDRSFRGFTNRPLDGGRISSRVEPRSSKSWVIEVAATWGGGRRRARVGVVETVNGFRVGGWRRLAAER